MNTVEGHVETTKNRTLLESRRCVEVVRFIKENSVSTFMSRITVEQGAGGQGKADGDSKARSDGGTASAEEAMMGRIGILVVCRFERLLVEEQVSLACSRFCLRDLRCC